MLLADTVNLYVWLMGVSSFWQTAAQHTFLNNFESTLHLMWPPSETLNATDASKLLWPFQCLVSLLFNRPLYPQLLLHLLLLSSFYTSATFSNPFPLGNRMTPLPFIKLAYGSETLWASKWEEKKRKGDVGEEERELPFNSWSTPPDPLWSMGFSCYPLFPAPPRFFLKHRLYPSRKTLEKEGDYVRGRYRGFKVRHWRNKQWMGFSIKSEQIIWLKQGEKMPLQAGSSDSKMHVLCLWYYSFDLLCCITYCLGIISFAALL